MKTSNIDTLRNYLAFLKEAGFLYLTPGHKDEAALPSAHQRAEQLEALRARASVCVLCKLCKSRTHVVFGEGSPDADLLFVGEGPGADEDAQARPFVGRSGQLLTKMIQEVGLKREDVFICNVVKCRPPENRDPELDEMDACEPYLKAQIALVRPKVIVTLGRFAAHRLTAQDTPITKMCGRTYVYEGTPLIPLLHPAAVLRNMSHLAETVEHLRRAVEVMRAT